MTVGRWVLHVDLDQFIAAVEVLRHPELRGKPVVVGGAGDPTQRAVVATASYEAREFGVHSGMPLRLAARKIPDAAFLPADNPYYEETSAQVMAVLRELPGVVLEVIGWDEAYLGVTTDDPEKFAASAQRAVLDTTGLWCSFGIGDNTLRAKIATDFGKPRGVYRLTEQNWFEVMADRSTQALHGVGKKTANRLAGLGITTVRELADTDPADLAAKVGPTMGPYYVAVGRGWGRTEVTGEPWVRRSRSRETTYQRDLLTWPDVQVAVEELARQVAADMVEDDRAAVRVGVKVRYKPFFTQIHAAKLPVPSRDPDVLTTAALRVLEQFDHQRPVRLLGVRFEYERS